MTSSALRSRLFKKARTNTRRITIEDPEGPLELELRELSADGRGAVLEAATRISVDDDGEKTNTVDQRKLVPAVLIACTFDPESGEPVFSDADRDAIGKMSSTFVDQIFKPAAELSALLESDHEDVKGNSDATPGSASGSPSPANSE